MQWCLVYSQLSTQHHNLIPEVSITPNKKSVAAVSHSPFHSPSSPWQHLPIFCLWIETDLLILDISWKWNHIMESVAFCVWLLSLCMVFSRSIHVARISTLFLFMAEQYSIIWIYCIVCLCSSVDGIWVSSTFWL